MIRTKSRKVGIKEAKKQKLFFCFFGGGGGGAGWFRLVAAAPAGGASRRLRSLKGPWPQCHVIGSYIHSCLSFHFPKRVDRQ